MFFGSAAEGDDCGCGGHHEGTHHAGLFHHARMHVAEHCDCGQEIPRRFMRPAVLLLLAEQPVHGYELMGKLKEFGIGHSGMDPSLLYRMLRLLERSGLAESSLDDSGSGPARKVYSLTPEGMEVLDLWAANLDGVTAFLQGFKERYEKLGK
jgi:PadR family transcriptional regulator